MSGLGRRNPNNKKGGRHPLPPPTIDGPKVHFDPHFIQQQPNAALQYPRNFAYNHRRLPANASGARYDGANPADNRLYMSPRSNTAYNSPEQHQLQIGPYGAPDFQGPYHNPYSLGVGIQYDEYNSPMYGPSNGVDYRTYSGIQQPQYEQHPGSAYYNHPGMLQPQYPVPVGYYTNSPPTPAASDQIEDRKRVKESNRPIAPHEFTDTPRVTPDDVPHSGKAPRHKSSETPVKPAKPAKAKKGKREVPPLTAPLSELTKSYDHIPLKDMDEWVNRSVETRLKECGKKEGWIPRPMNSFMMYRSAYAERTKHWCLQNNHQVVSSVSGLSWPMEPLEVRDLYIEYARQERENHAKAHPGYKFCPTKTDASRRKRKGATKEPDDDESVDLEELDCNWQPIKSNKNIKRKGRAKKAKTSYNSQHPVDLEFQVEYEAHAAPGPSPTEQSTFEFNNPGKHCPPQLDNLQHGEYYQTIVNSNPLGTTRVEDLSLLKTEASHSHYGGVHPFLVGLPGAQYTELLDPQLNENDINSERNPDVDVPLDPNLDTLFSDSDFDFDQLGELDGSMGQTILQGLDHAGLFDILGSETVGPQVSGNQHQYQNEAEQDYQNSPRNETPNEYQNGYQNVYRDVYQNQCPEEDEDERPSEFPNISEKGSFPGNQGPKPQKKLEKLNQEELDDEKPDDGKPGDGKPGDGKPGDGKPGDEKPDDEKPSDEKLGREKPGHEKPYNEKLGHEKLGHEKLGHEKLGHEKPDDEKLGHEKLGHEKLDHGPSHNK